MPAWRNWYHAMASTYGSWLPGDPRGFRTRGHREHIEGDYKSLPPAGRFTTRHAAAERRLRHNPVAFSLVQRRIVLSEFQQTLSDHEVRVIALAVSANHVHVLGQFLSRSKPMLNQHGLRNSAVDDPVRHMMGIAKQWTSKRLIREGHFIRAPIWGKRGKIVPIHDRSHQVNVFEYIMRHANEGAAVWCFRDAL